MPEQHNPKNPDDTSPELKPMTILLDRSLGAEHMMEVLEAFGDLYQAMSGDQLVIRKVDGAEADIPIGGNAAAPNIYDILRPPPRPQE